MFKNKLINQILRSISIEDPNKKNNKIKFKIKTLSTNYIKGSSRICLPLDNNRVIKIAYNKAGVLQNQTELEIWSKANLSQKYLLSKIYTRVSDNLNFRYIVQERVFVLNKKSSLQHFNKKKQKINKILNTFNLETNEVDYQIGLTVNNRSKIYDYGLTKEIWKKYY